MITFAVLFGFASDSEMIHRSIQQNTDCSSYGHCRVWRAKELAYKIVNICNPELLPCDNYQAVDTQYCFVMVADLGHINIVLELC